MSDRLRRTVGITQQNTLDDSKLKGRKLSTTIDVQRRSSISIPPKYSEKPLLSSFEENSGSCTLLTAEISNNISDKDNKSNLNRSESPCAPIISVSSALDDSTHEASTEKDSLSSEVETVLEPTENELKKNQNEPKCNLESKSETESDTEVIEEVQKALESDPIELESVSNVSEEVLKVLEEVQMVQEGDIDVLESVSTIPEDEINVPKISTSLPKVPECDSKVPEGLSKLPKDQEGEFSGRLATLAPLAVPDSESPCSEVNPDFSESREVSQDENKEKDNEEDDNKQKEICPWEDE